MTQREYLDVLANRWYFRFFLNRVKTASSSADGKRDDTARRPVTKFAGRAHPRQDVTGDVSSVNSQKPEIRRGTRDKKRGKKVEKENTEVEKKSSGGRRGKKIELNRPEGHEEGKATGGARQQFYDSGARLKKEWQKRRGCIYGERTKRCEFHSISRPLTIERVHSSVCTQDISTESSFVEVLRNAERNLLPSSEVISSRRTLLSAYEKRFDAMEEQNVAKVGNRSSPDSPHIVPADRGFSTPLEPGN
ncbi:hypothetical protein ALC56_06159 [Trachymyrmex septentrionalis]|uniref:Uncharacterized protein n=1 Tax=Trachymyrmex septentrionalis TaxID=34720 RepID=A0A195FI55_9HYME|nr:hypothetical protein ALC56_06159 [Trachymyrmex septentrionalis]